MEHSFSQSRPILEFVSIVMFDLETPIQINQTMFKVD
jgi:hypothetical protein